MAYDVQCTNGVPGSSKGVMADSVAAFVFFIRTRYSMFEARQWGEDQERSSHSEVFRVLHFTNIHRFLLILMEELGIHRKLLIEGKLTLAPDI